MAGARIEQQRSCLLECAELNRPEGSGFNDW
jgi:hypothetical protein